MRKLILALVALAVSTPAFAQRHKHINSYNLPGSHRDCVEAWRVKDGLVGVSGYCVPPHVGRERPLLRALAPYGSMQAREFYDELDRYNAGTNVH
jgi:hypothetical protein